MAVEIDYKALEKLVPSDLVEKIKEKVDSITEDPYLSDIQKFEIQDWENHIMIGISTISLIYVYQYNKRYKEYDIKRLSIADYWFIKDMLEGGK
ncbi:hypothetical protein ACFSKI_19005 [Pseudogracilibacillus auburnensis]|uniref:Uncharacterized protein n=1 Tax=Pseudogracilibacillus auburnensis TaxID=1494959 RepID=A0A2V3W972_9BACI|nr:hypothetical protein [Pseudogracilibacillus auburnensis]PXW88785.1 hypothetical protein DFR56_103291 [Pseudogracilibacillus auburnensis]